MKGNLIRSAVGFGLVALVAALAGCPGTPKMPTGPAPEYVDPPAPSWLKDAGKPDEATDAGPPAV